MRIFAASATDVGRVRAENQDRLLASIEQGLFAVADGMGGLESGGTASGLAIECLAQRIPPAHMATVSEATLAAKRYLLAGFEAADRRIAATATEIDSLGSMGTTLVALLLNSSGYFIANVGDSRAYLIRDGTIRCLTRDHSYVQELINEGRLSREAARRHPQRNVISRYLGSGSGAAVDFFYGAISSGDLFLLASDGVTMHLRDQELLDVCAGEPDLSELVDRLIRVANEAGGEDNATVIAARTDRAGDGPTDTRTLVRRAMSGQATDERSGNERPVGGGTR